MNSISNPKLEDKMTSTLVDLVGETVRVALGGGSFLNGEVQEVNAEQVKVRGRWLPIAAVTTEDEIEHVKKSNIDRERRIRVAEQEAKEAVELAQKSGPPVLMYKPTGTETYTDFTPWFSSEDYTLLVQVRSDSHDVAAAEYASWGGESIPHEHIREYSEHFTDSEWILTFPFNETAKYPFPIVLSGTGGGKALGEPAGILSGSAVRVNFKSIIEPLVRSGLRTRL